MCSTCVQRVLLRTCELSDPLQAHLVIDTNMTVADIKTVVVGAQTVAEDTQLKVSKMQAMVADIHRKVLTGQEGNSSQVQSVSETSIRQRRDAYRLLDPNKVSDTRRRSDLHSYVFTVYRSVNCLPRPRGAVSDATS